MSTRQATAIRPAATGQAGKGQRKPKGLSWTDVNKLVADVKAENDTSYLKLSVEGEGNAEHFVLRKGQTLQITGALNYAKKNGVPVQKNDNTVLDAWIYYPDLRIVGFIGDIIDFFDSIADNNHQDFPVGEKYELVKDAEEKSGNQYVTWATQGNQNVSLDVQDRDTILYRNSFDPFATAVDTNVSSFGYTFNSDGGEEADIIDVLYKTARGERKEFPLQRYIAALHQAALYSQGLTKVSPWIKGANTQKIVDTFDDLMDALIAYYRANNYSLDSLLAETRPGVKKTTKLEALDVSDFNPIRNSPTRVVSLPYNIKSGSTIIPMFTLDGRQVLAPVVFDPYSFGSARDFANVIASPQRVVLKEGAPEQALNSAHQNYANEIAQSINQLAQQEGYIFSQPYQLTKGTGATAEQSTTTRRRRGEATAAAPAAAPAARTSRARAAPAAPSPTSNAGSAFPARQRQAAPAAVAAAPPRQAAATRQTAAAPANTRQGAFPNRQTAAAPSANPAPQNQRAFPAGQTRPAAAGAFPPASRVPGAGARGQPAQAPARRLSQEGPTPSRRVPSRQPSPQAPVSPPQEIENFEEGFEPFDGEAAASPNGSQVRSRASSRTSSLGGGASPRVDFAE